MSSKQKSTKKASEIIFEILLYICAGIAVLSLLSITVYLLYRGGPAIFKIGPVKFITGTDWNPTAGKFGILPMILATIYSTAGASVLGVAVGVLTAVMLAEFAPKKLAAVLRTATDLLAGIPSVVYGFWGLTTIVPLIRLIFGEQYAGNSLLAVILILAIMILPTIISITETSLRAVPRIYKEGSLALGATKAETIFKVQIPAAKSGIMSGVVLGIGRALGETMAVVLIAGGSVQIPQSLLDTVRTLTGGIIMEMGYSQGLHRDALFGIGVVLFIFITIINLAVHALLNRSVKKL